MRTSDTPKWKVVENVVAAIERSLNAVEGARVIANASVPERISGVPRQVDVYVEIPTGPRVLRIGVEVRDRAVALDLPEVEQLIAKLKKLDIDYGCVVSGAGFTGTAKGEADRNGIELLSIAEVENPKWWLPSAMHLDMRKVELVHLQVNFRREELDYVTSLLAGISGSDLELTLVGGEAVRLLAFIQAQGMEMVNRPELGHLIDQDTFAATIELSGLRGATLQCPRGPVPLPQSVNASYRFHRRLESVKLAAYEGPEGINAFTGVFPSCGKQITVVTKLNSDGTRSISFTVDDPNPPKTAIGRRGEAAMV